MKFSSLLLLLLFFQYGFATTFYISPKGNDNNGNGSISNPWQSLFKATAVANAAGDIIHVLPGTYTEVARCILAPGVSIEGEGPSSVIQSTLNQEYVAIIIAVSAEGTNGNQHISNIKLSGNNRTTSWGIEIRGRSNVSIHDCVITDFEDRGIVWTARTDNEEAPPAVYATGNYCYNNIITNCAKYDGYGRGCLNIGGQQGMLIYNNTITQTARGKGANGWPVKYYNGGFLKGCKIYNNTITKAGFDGLSWDFAIELFNEWGLEIYSNTIVGSIDLNHQNKGEYPYSVYIHDNIIGPATMQAKMENGIILEFETNNVLIENNSFKNLGTIINFTPRNFDAIASLTIKNNVCSNIGIADNSHEGYALRVGREGSDSYMISNIQVVNNKFLGSSTAKPYWGIAFLGLLRGNNINIQQNSFTNFSAGAVMVNPASAIDTLLFENNTLNANGNNNSPSFYNGGPRNFITRGNTYTQGSVFSVANVKMNVVRPLFYEFKSQSLLQLIALVAVFLCTLLSYKENIYIFPISLIASFIYVFVNLDKGFTLQALLGLYFTAMGIYGWRLWAKRNRRGHRIIRITPAAATEKKYQLLVFVLVFAAAFLLLAFGKAYFSEGSIAWANAFITATSFTAAWQLTRKKVESWYWWMACTLLAIPFYFFQHYLLMSLFFCGLLVMEAIGLYKWKRRIIKKPRGS